MKNYKLNLGLICGISALLAFALTTNQRLLTTSALTAAQLRYVADHQVLFNSITLSIGLLMPLGTIVITAGITWLLALFFFQTADFSPIFSRAIQVYWLVVLLNGIKLGVLFVFGRVISFSLAGFVSGPWQVAILSVLSLDTIVYIGFLTQQVAKLYSAQGQAKVRHFALANISFYLMIALAFQVVFTGLT
ncbi:MAG: hypothetical protein LKF36_10760 [Lactobacillus sp.]|nr:hypothetical protein [Lactobacillus sp.]